MGQGRTSLPLGMASIAGEATRPVLNRRTGSIRHAAGGSALRFSPHLSGGYVLKRRTAQTATLASSLCPQAADRLTLAQGSQTRAQPLHSPALRAPVATGSLRASRGTVRPARPADSGLSSRLRTSVPLHLHSASSMQARFTPDPPARREPRDSDEHTASPPKNGGGTATRPVSVALSSAPGWHSGRRAATLLAPRIRCVTGPPTLLPCRDITDIVRSLWSSLPPRIYSYRLSLSARGTPQTGIKRRTISHYAPPGRIPLATPPLRTV